MARIKTIPRFNLTQKNKETVIAHLKGDISGYEAARRLNIKHREYLYHEFYKLFRMAVQKGHLDLEKLLDKF